MATVVRKFLGGTRELCIRSTWLGDDFTLCLLFFLLLYDDCFFFLHFSLFLFFSAIHFVTHGNSLPWNPCLLSDFSGSGQYIKIPLYVRFTILTHIIFLERKDELTFENLNLKKECK